MAESALTASRQSDLLALLRGADDWPTKKAALVAFDFAPGIRSDGVMDNVPPPTAPNSWDELEDAAVSGLLSEDQVGEVVAALDHGDAPTTGEGKGEPVTLPPDDPDAR